MVGIQVSSVRNHMYVARPCTKQFYWLMSPISQDLPILPANQLHQPLTILHCSLFFITFLVTVRLTAVTKPRVSNPYYN